MSISWTNKEFDARDVFKRKSKTAVVDNKMCVADMKWI
jgi:hypothetical protein